MNPKTTIHLTAPNSRNYAYPCVIAGMLTENSTERLVKLYANKGPSSQIRRKSKDKAAKAQELKDKKELKKEVDDEKEEGEISE